MRLIEIDVNRSKYKNKTIILVFVRFFFLLIDCLPISDNTISYDNVSTKSPSQY